MANSAVGVLLMTYGSATTAEQVAEYMKHVYKENLPAGVVEDFENRYRLVGPSPLIEITREQAAKLEAELNGNDNTDNSYLVRVAMLHSEPFIETVTSELRKQGAGRIYGIILSPQYSSFIMAGYNVALTKAAAAAGFGADAVGISGPWPVEPRFIQLLSRRVKQRLAMLSERFGPVPVVYTTHSLPERVVAKDPAYIDQLQATADAVTASLNIDGLEWYRAYQSAGHSPEAWLKPDLVDILDSLRKARKKSVLIVPIQFLADHLEILYDLDIAAKEQCDEYGIIYNRIELPNTDPLFISALADLVRRPEIIKETAD